MKRFAAVFTVASLCLVGTMLIAPAASATEPHNRFEDCDGPEDPFNVIVGTRGADRLIGTDCNDQLFGLAGNDVLRGKLGYDILRGGRNNDRLVDLSFLVGGQLRGGTGWDTCIIAIDSPVSTFSCEEVIEVG